MPLADPSTSFEASVRHLFRHFDDPKALKRNPLVKAFFSVALWDGDGRSHANPLERIHSLVLTATAHYRDADVYSGNGRRAYRQYFILTRYYFQKTPEREIAAALGISMRQYYRERTEICRRVGNYLRRYEEPGTPRITATVEQAELWMREAAARAEAGDLAGALEEYQVIAHTAEKQLEEAAQIKLRASISAAIIMLETDSEQSNELERGAEHVPPDESAAGTPPP